MLVQSRPDAFKAIIHIDNSRMHFKTLDVSVLRLLFSGQSFILTRSTTLAKIDSATCSLDQSTFFKEVESNRSGVDESTRVTAFETTKVLTKDQNYPSTKYALHTALTAYRSNSTSCEEHLERPSAYVFDLPDLYIKLKSYVQKSN